MDNSVLNTLQIYRTKWFSGLVDEPTLADKLLTEPHRMSMVISHIFGRFDQGNVIDYITTGLGRSVTVENREYTWDVMIDFDKAVDIRAAYIDGGAVTSTDTPGINGQPIQLHLSERWFGPGAVLEFDDNDYQVRVDGEPFMDGSDWVYTVYVADGGADSYIPPSLLAAGKQVSRVGSAYEERSDEADIVNYQTPFKLKNFLTTMRMTYSITGDAYSSVMVIEFKDPKTGKSTRYISDYQEWLALRQWYERVDRMTLYSKYNADENGVVNLRGTNGRPVYIGAGVFQQVSPSNKRGYTTLTLDILDNFLFDLSYNIRGRSDRKFLLLTGEMGMKEFDRVLRQKASSYSLIDTTFVSGSGQNLTLGGQFVTYRGLNGIEVTIKHLPILDNIVYNRKLHPISGRPLESYKMLFLDVSMKDGQPNLQKVVRKDRELVMFHVAGAVAPGGHAKSIGTMRSNAKDSYDVNFLSEQGVVLRDPTTSGILYCDAE